MAVAIGAIWPQFWTWQSSIPESAHITGQLLIGLLVWYLMFCVFAFISPEKLVKPFIGCAIAFIGTCIGLITWAVSAAGGGGKLWSTPNTAPSDGRALASAICVVTSAWATVRGSRRSGFEHR